MEVTRHFTATTLLVCENKVLLHMHKRLKRWLPVGGHIDRDELPQEAALREIKEESGYDAELFNPRELVSFPDVQELIPPVHVFLEDINEFHQHIDFVFFARVSSFEIHPEAEAFDTLQWFTLEEVESNPDMPKDIVFLTKEALSLLHST